MTKWTARDMAYRPGGLPQPENEFNPDWDAMAVMVEEQQRMAKRIEELEAALPQLERQWVELTTAERKALWSATKKPSEFAELIEAKLREKNERPA